MNGALVAGTIDHSTAILVMCFVSFLTGIGLACYLAKRLTKLDCTIEKAQTKNEKDHDYFRAHFDSLDKEFGYFSKDTDQIEKKLKHVTKKVNYKLSQKRPPVSKKEAMSS